MADLPRLMYTVRMAYVSNTPDTPAHADDKEHPNDFDAPQRKRRSRKTRGGEQASSSKLELIRWFMIGGLLAIMSLVLIGAIAWIQVQQLISHL